MDDEKEKTDEQKPRKDCYIEVPCAGIETEGKPLQEEK